jgi:hypothetical protein
MDERVFACNGSIGDLSAETSSTPTKIRFAISRSDLFGYHRGFNSPVIWGMSFYWPTAKGA